jgi:hypothetical protein
MLNLKQIELSQRLFDQLKQQAPDIELLKVVESPENPHHVWVDIAMPTDEERELAVISAAAELSTDILLDYGYYILAVPGSKTLS